MIRGSNGAYYNIAKNTRKEVVFEPYSYTAAGRQILMMSLAVPIIEDGRVIGVAGVDISTEGIWNVLKTAKPFETGSVFLISNGGIWAAYSNASHLGQPILKTNERLKAAIPAIRDGKPFEQFSISASLQKEVKQLFLPVLIGNSGTPWSILVNLPIEKIEAPKNELRVFIILGSVGLLAVLLIALWLASREVVGKPLRRVITINPGADLRRPFSECGRPRPCGRDRRHQPGVASIQGKRRSHGGDGAAAALG